MSMRPPSTPPSFRLDGRVAIVTGGAGLLGGHHASALCEAGANVVLSDTDLGTCEARAASLNSSTGVKAIAVKCDVTSGKDWRNLVERTVEILGRVDVLVNDAAATVNSQTPNYSASFEEFPLADWNRIIDVNLTGSFLGCQAVASQMLSQGQGSIINIASLYGIVSPHHSIYGGTGVSQPVAYSVSKSGILGLTRYLATLWASLGVRVNTLSPGGVLNNQSTDFTTRYASLSPIGRMAAPEEMGGAVVFLASDASSYCTGQNLIVDGGWTAW